MSGYVRNVEVTVKHDGKEFRIVLTPLKRSDFLMLEQGRQHQVETFGKYADALPAYVKEHNVADAAGESVEPNEWCAVAYFVPMITEIMRAHVKAAQVANP